MNILKKISYHRVFTLLLLALAAACLGLLCLWFGAVDNRTAMFASYLASLPILLLNLIPVVVLALALYCLVGRAWLAFALTGVATAAVTMANFFKLTFRNDPLLFEDLLLIREAGDMAGKYQLFLSKSMVLALALVVVGTVCLAFFARSRLTGRWLRLGGIAAVLLVCLPLQYVYGDEGLYNNKTANNSLINPWSATQVYTSKGVIYPFLHSIRAASDAPPPGYSPRRAQDILGAYPAADIPPEQRVDVISIMLEAYNDFSRLGAPALNRDVYQVFHQLEAEGVSGNLVTNIFAGGTVDTERCFLTGFSTLGSFRAPTNSYVRYFQEQGYHTEGSHSCYQWFYNRLNINANLGFQDYYFSENHYGALTEGDIAYDDLFFPELIALHEAHKKASDAPYFTFNLTYQGHGPYDTDCTWWGDDYVVPAGYSTEELNILNNYFGSIYNTNENLAQFFDHYRQSPDPVVIVLFGDHNPWLGDSNSVYHTLGIDLDVSTQQGFLNYYSTRYLIWANAAAKQTLGRDFSGVGPDIGPYFLMNEVFRQCGWTGNAYMQATQQLMEQVPVVHTTGLYLENGTLTHTLTPEGAALAEDFRCLQYYYRKHLQQ